MSFSNASSAVLKLVNRVMGIAVTYTYLESGETSEIKGVFDNAFVEILGVSTLKPILKIRLSDLDAEPLEGDTVSIDSVEYKVLDHQPDSHGASVIILQKV